MVSAITKKLFAVSSCVLGGALIKILRNLNKIANFEHAGIPTIFLLPGRGNAMKNSNLISLLRSFSKDEFNHFGKFIRSPFYNTHKDIVRYYAFLKKYYPAFDQKSLTKENIFRQVYPGRKFSNSELLKLNSRLNHLGTEFLKSIEGRFFGEYNLLTHYVDRNLGKQFRTLYNSLNSYIDNEAELDNLIFVRKIYLESLLVRYNMNRDRQKEICGNIIKRGNYFAYQSLLWIIIQLRDMRANYNAFNYGYESSGAYKFICAVDLDRIISELEFEDNRLGRYLEYYIYCLMIILHPDKENYFLKFKETYDRVKNEVNRLERNNYLARMQTYVMGHVQRGNMKYSRELIDAYRYFFNEEDVFENDHIPMPPFRNALSLAVNTHDMDFARELIDKFSVRVYPEYRQDTIRLAKASLGHTLKNYDSVFENLKIFDYSYAPHKIDVRNLLLKVYFETGNFEAFQSQVDSFRHFLHKDKTLSAKNRTLHSNFVNVTNILNSARMDGKQDIINELKKNVPEDKYELFVFDKLWLLNQIEKLLK
jgi:hypothetical protein